MDAYVDSVDALAAALATDPVNVQQARGNGHTAVIDAALSDLVASADVPVVVALVGDLPDLAPADPAGDLIARLQARLGQDGFYVVAIEGRGTTWEYVGTDDQVALYSRSTTWTEARYESGEEPPLPFVVAAFSAMLGVLVALVGWRLSRTWVLRSVTPAPPRAAPWSWPDARAVVAPKT